MKDVFDRILSSTPINKTAGVATSRGEHWEPNKKIVQAHWESPPKMRRVHPGSLNLVGAKFGRFTVVGLFNEQAPRGDKPVKWVVRCICGDYELRTSKSIRNPRNDGDRCDKCRHLFYLQRRERWARTGKDIDMHSDQSRRDPARGDDAHQAQQVTDRHLSNPAG